MDLVVEEVSSDEEFVTDCRAELFIWQKQEVDVKFKCSSLNPEILGFLVSNDPAVAGLRLDAGLWIKGADRAIGASTVLRRFQLELYYDNEYTGEMLFNDEWLPELC